MVALAGWLGTVAGVYGLARTIFAGSARDRRAKLRSLLDELAREVGDSIAGR